MDTCTEGPGRETGFLAFPVQTPHFHTKPRAAGQAQDGDSGDQDASTQAVLEAAAACPHAQTPTEGLHPGTQPLARGTGRAPCTRCLQPPARPLCSRQLRAMQRLEVSGLSFNYSPPAKVKTCFPVKSSPPLTSQFILVAVSYSGPSMISTFVLIFHTYSPNQANTKH